MAFNGLRWNSNDFRMIDLANYSLDWYDDLTKSDYHGNSNVADTKK